MENETKELVDSLKPIITKNGILISGNGMIANNTEKGNEILDKIQKFLYFMEKRQKEMQEQNDKIISILESITKGLNS